MTARRDAATAFDPDSIPEAYRYWTAALMGPGATICRPVRPACHHCPVAVECAARALGITVHDHVVVGGREAASLKALGLI